MAYLPIALFSRVVKPGQPLELEEYDRVITSVTFGENVKGNGRTCLKIQFNDVADIDDEVDEPADVIDNASGSKPETKASKMNGKAAPSLEADEDEDEEDDEDSEDDSLLNFVVRETVLATLIPGKIENVQLNVTLVSNETYKLVVTGDNEVHVTGQYIHLPEPDFDSDDSDEDSEYDSEGLEIPFDEDDALSSEWGKYDPSKGLPGGELTDLVAMSDEDDEDDEEDDEDDSERFEELEPSPKKAKANGAAAKMPTADDDDESDVDMAEAVSKAAPAKGADVSMDGLSKNQRKKLAKKLAKEKAGGEVTAVNGSKTETVSIAKDGKKTVEVSSKAEVTVKQADGAEAKEKAKKASKKVSLPSGLSYTENKTGKGPQVKSGQKVEIRYVGKLENGKIFDSNTKGKPFSFAVGKSEVIKGMDEGVVGMAPGGERKLHIPAKLAYGKSGNGEIPSNANLTFDIKLISIK